MNATTRTLALALLSLALGGIGCGEQIEPHNNTGPRADDSAPTPAVVAESAAEKAAESAADKPGSSPAPNPTPVPASTGTVNPPPDSAGAEPAPAKAKAAETAPGAAAEATGDPGKVTLEKVSYDAFLNRVANNPSTPKYTLVDAWASWCGPCKENFPHVIEMHKKYGPKGLAVASLSFDDPANSKQVDDALAFLREKKATLTNYLLDEGEGVGFEKFGINAIPAVFLYGPDGKEVKRFTLDDPNNQFTYEDVERTVASLLEAR